MSYDWPTYIFHQFSLDFSNEIKFKEITDTSPRCSKKYDQKEKQSATQKGFGVNYKKNKFPLQIAL